MTRLGDTLARAEQHAPFLRMLLRRRPEIARRLEADGLAATHAHARVEAVADPVTAHALRRERQAVALAVALADLAGLASLEDVVAALSDFADRALDRAIRTAIAERGGEGTAGFTALALGKHGSRELNYSSDIDPVLVFDPERLHRRAGEEPVEAAVRVARRVVELLQTRDGDGYVLRVDLRLRPSPEATPLAVPIDAAIAYYESSALPWERAAFIRARAAAGDMALGDAFLAAIRPFVWRSAVGFGAVSEIRGISRRIRAHHAGGQAFGPGFDLKRGRGGIREVEFFAQIHQLIHGGRDPALRAPATLNALAALGRAGWIDADEARTLADAYRLFRTVEHRLQMVDDMQTHRLPADAAALDNVARLDGRADGAALLDLLRPHVAAVGAIYDGLEPEGDQRLPEHADALDARLAAIGFPDPRQARLRIEAWRGGTVRAVRTPAARSALEAMLPALVGAFGGAPDPMAVLVRFDALLAGLPTAIDFFRLLEARPQLASLLRDLLVHAPVLGAALGRRPALLEGLIDATALAPIPPVAQLAAEFAGTDQDGDLQGKLDRVQRRVQERRFAIGAQLVARSGDPYVLANAYARVAEAAIGTLAGAVIAEFERAHGRVPGGELAMLGLGRLGGGALTHASDLDLVYLFTGDHLAESDGARPLGATLYFNRLAQRVGSALAVPTATGPLYDVDTRLRPSGKDGLLAVSVDSFARYQRENAWTWEHMALARARAVHGSAAARAAIAAVIGETLRRPRDIAALRADARSMRGEMARHKPPAGPFDVKLIAGGLVDLEFATHVSQLAHGEALFPALGEAVPALVLAGRLDAGMIEAERLLTRMLVTLRLVAPGGGQPDEASRPLVAAACGMHDWPALVEAYAATRALVMAEWARVSAA